VPARVGLWKRPAGRFPETSIELVESCQAGDTRCAAAEAAAGIMKILNSRYGTWLRLPLIQVTVAGIFGPYPMRCYFIHIIGTITFIIKITEAVANIHPNTHV
jgi:hypothetical protein